MLTLPARQVPTRRAGSVVVVCLLVAASLLCVPLASGDESAILTDIKDFFATTDASSRRRYAERIAADPAYDPNKLGSWLHRAGLFEALPPGRHTLSVIVPPGDAESAGDRGRPRTRDPRAGERGAAQPADGSSGAAIPAGSTTLSLRLRIPQGYDAKRAWALLYCLHGTGGSADSYLDFVETMLGDAADLFVLAAPDNYQEVGLHEGYPPRGEHAAALAHLKRRVNIDSDRVFVTGYSRGGHTTWTLAMLMPDQFAGALPLAGSLLLPEREGLFPDFLPNARHLPILCVWGDGDTHSERGGASPHGGIAALNRALAQRAQELNIPVTGIELADTGHGGVTPPLAPLAKLLAGRRVTFPSAVQARFRHVSQARCAWIEGHEWTGPRWDDKPLKAELREGESAFDEAAKHAALQRAYRQRLGSLSGEIVGNEIKVGRKQISTLTVWIGREMVDWSQTVSVSVSGREVFRGNIEPDLLLCLTRAAQTWDFERLCWAGVRFRSGNKAALLRGADLND